MKQKPKPVQTSTIDRGKISPTDYLLEGLFGKPSTGTMTSLAKNKGGINNG